MKNKLTNTPYTNFLQLLLLPPFAKKWRPRPTGKWSITSRKFDLTFIRQRRYFSATTISYYHNRHNTTLPNRYHNTHTVEQTEIFCKLILLFFSSTTLCEFWLAELFLSISSSPASFVSNYSFPSSSSHSSHRPPVLLLAFPSVLLHTVSICIWSWPLFHRSFFLHAPTSPVVCILYILLYFRY